MRAEIPKEGKTVGLFKKKPAATSHYTGPPGVDMSRVDFMDIEGRRQCPGCWMYFVPTGDESTCSAECTEKSGK